MTSAGSRRSMSIIRRVYPEYDNVDWRKVKIPEVTDANGASAAWVMPASNERWRVTTWRADTAAYPQYDAAVMPVKMRLHLSQANKMYSSAFKVLLKYSNFVLRADLTPATVQLHQPMVLPRHYLHAYENDVEDVKNYVQKMYEAGYEPLGYGLGTSVRANDYTAVKNFVAVLSPCHVIVAPSDDEKRDDAALSMYPLAGSTLADVRLLRRMSIFGYTTDEKAVVKRCVGQLFKAYDHLGSAFQMFLILKAGSEAGSVDDPARRRFAETKLLMSKREQAFFDEASANPKALEFLRPMAVYPDYYNPIQPPGVNSARIPCSDANLHARLRAYAMSIMLGYMEAATGAHRPGDVVWPVEKYIRAWHVMCNSGDPRNVSGSMFNYRLAYSDTSVPHVLRDTTPADPEFKRTYELVVTNIKGTTASNRIFHWASINMADMLAYYIENFKEARVRAFKIAMEAADAAMHGALLKGKMREMMSEQRKRPVTDAEVDAEMVENGVDYGALSTFYVDHYEEQVLAIWLQPLNALYMQTMYALVMQADELRVRDPLLRKTLEKAQKDEKKDYAREAKASRKETQNKTRREHRKDDKKERRAAKEAIKHFTKHRNEHPEEAPPLPTIEYEPREDVAAAEAEEEQRPERAGGGRQRRGEEEAGRPPKPPRTMGISQPALDMVLTEALIIKPDDERVARLQRLTNVLLGPRGQAAPVAVLGM